jgi:tetratricopeptide (TPR) repeat protein
MPLTASEHLQAGLAEHRAGNLSVAAQHYCKTLESAPSDADALHLLGLLLSENGEHGRALAMLSRAVELRPNATFLANLGLALRRAGDQAAAIAAYREALRFDPLHTPTLGKLGRVLIDAGEHAEAERVLLQALFVDALNPELRNALGHARAAQRRYAEARADFAQALAIDPSFTEAGENLAHALLHLANAEAAAGSWESAAALFAEGRARSPQSAALWYGSGLASMALGRSEEAAQFYTRAIVLAPEMAEAHNNLGHLQQAAGDVSAALRSYERALAGKPDYSDARYNLALTLQNAGRVPEAETQYERLLEGEPTHPDALNNLGGIRLSQNRVEQAKLYLTRALGRAPTHVDARWNLSLAHLTLGEWEKGWSFYEARLEQSAFPKRDFGCPRWRGESLSGKTICVWAEQGLGDTIQFMRYLPLLIEAGARVAFEVQERLHPFLSSLLRDIPEVAVHPRGGELPSTVFHIPLLSLPSHFPGIPPVWLPGRVEPAPRQSTQLTVGLCWAGHPHHIKGRHRSIPLVELTPLGEHSRARFVSLQRGPQEAERNALPGPWRPLQVETDSGGIAELASLIASLDLVITVDTMVAHLAGTIGKPVWTLLPFAADWRWMLDREDSPWYPNMRLFRQSAPGEWAPVVARIGSALEALA